MVFFSRIKLATNQNLFMPQSLNSKMLGVARAWTQIFPRSLGFITWQGKKEQMEEKTSFSVSWLLVKESQERNEPCWCACLIPLTWKTMLKAQECHFPDWQRQSRSLRAIWSVWYGCGHIGSIGNVDVTRWVRLTVLKACLFISFCQYGGSDVCRGGIYRPNSW